MKVNGTAVQRAIENAKARLPKDLLEQPLLSKFTTSDEPTVKLMIVGSASEELLRQVTLNLQADLRAKTTISSVKRVGYRDRQVRIMLDPAKMAQFGLSFEEIEQAIKGRNVTETGGSLETFITEQNVVMLGEFEHPSEIGSVIIRANSHGDYLRLDDVADVVLDYEDWRERYFYKGQPGILLEVIRSPSTNEITIVDEIQQYLKAVQGTLPNNVRVVLVEDSSLLTRSLVTALSSNAIVGMLLITVALLLFFPWRAMIWVVVGLPVAILLGLLFLLSMDIAIVAAVFIAVILMMGLLVDDAIVTSESIYSFYERGFSPQDSAVNGLLAVFKPVCTGAATTVLAMTPMLMIGGFDAKWIWLIPTTVICLIAASLVETMVFLPSHLASSLAHHGKPKTKANWFVWLEKRYENVLAFYLRRPWQSAVALTAFALVSLILISSSISFQAYPVVESNEILIRAEMPTGTSLERTSLTMHKLEQAINNSDVIPHIASTYIAVGHHQGVANDNLIEGQQKNWGKIYVRLNSHNARRVSAAEIERHLKTIASGFTEFDFLLVETSYPRPPIGYALELAINAPDEHRGVIATELLAYLNEVPGVTRAWSDYSPGINTLELDLNYERMADYGLKVSQLTKAIKIAFDGVIVEELQTSEELIRYRLQLQDQYRHRVETLPSLPIITDRGETVPLRNVANFVSGRSETAVLRKAGKRTETVFANINIKETNTVKLNQMVKSFIEENKVYQRFPGVNFTFGGEIESQAESARAFAGGLLMVFLSIFTLMAILFNSITLPLITLMVIPVSFIGVLLVFTLQGITLSLIAVVGFMGLTGVLVNGSLVMIDRIQSLHKEKGRTTSYLAVEDIAEGAVNRLRPLMITGITGFVGLGPAAYGLAGTDPSTQDMLVVMFWGIGVGSLATLFALPIYLVLESRCRRWFDERRKVKAA